MWQIIAHRTSASIFGAARSPLKHNGEPMTWPTKEAADTECERLNRAVATPNVYYVVEEVP